MSPELFKLAADSTRDGLTISDALQPDMPLIYVNPAFEQMTGYSQADSLGRNCRYLQGDDTQQPALTVLREHLQTATDCIVTLKNYRKDGSLFWNELRMSPIFGTNGQLTHFIGIQKDVTAQVELKANLARSLKELETSNASLAARERELARLNDSLRLFVGYAAHDLRSPLGVISSLAKYGQGQNCDETRRLELLNRIQESADSCLELVSSFLDDAALGTGKLALNATNSNLGVLARRSLDNIAELAAGQELQISETISDMLAVQVDVPRMIQVFTNLFINAVKYSPPGSQIQLSAAPDDQRPGHCRVTLSNTIAAEPNRLNESSVYRSIGLGLSIVDAILKAHGTESQVEQQPDRYQVSFSLKLAGDDTA